MPSRKWIVLVLFLAGCAATPAPTAPTAVAPLVLAEQSRALSARLGLGPGLAHRHLTRTLSKADRRVIARIERRQVFPIADLRFERAGTFDQLKDVPDDAAAYVLVDEKDKTMRPVAWHDTRTGDVIELSTGYRLRVLDAPGVGTRPGKSGESFFVYGYGWYARWNRVLPEPTITQLRGFYSTGIAHVKAHLEQYREVAKPTHSGGDLMLVTWDKALLERMSDWGKKLPAAPYAHLPDSGKIDIRPERFKEAVAHQRVVVDADSLRDYRAAERTVARFGKVPSERAIKEVLLAPFRQPELFTLADQAIILDAVFEGEDPLRLIIDASVDGGFFVPDNGNKEVHVAYSEVDLNFRYNGLIFAKLAHEAHHVIEFRQRPFLAERCWHQRDDVIETLKYLAEFMWWVEQYPGDAPNWDWAPINAGIVLASLLEGYFPNSRC